MSEPNYAKKFMLAPKPSGAHPRCFRLRLAFLRLFLPQIALRIDNVH